MTTDSVYSTKQAASKTGVTPSEASSGINDSEPPRTAVAAPARPSVPSKSQRLTPSEKEASVVE
jgi:hypothetical protein